TYHFYPDDNASRLVPNGFIETATPSFKLWVTGGEHIHPDYFTNRDYLLDSKYAFFADYLKTVGVYKCPGDRDEPSGYTKLRSYALNCYLNWQTPEDSVFSGSRLTVRKQSDLAGYDGSKYFTFIDGVP